MSFGRDETSGLFSAIFVISSERSEDLADMKRAGQGVRFAPGPEMPTGISLLLPLRGVEWDPLLMPAGTWWVY